MNHKIVLALLYAGAFTIAVPAIAADTTPQETIAQLKSQLAQAVSMSHDCSIALSSVIQAHAQQADQK